MWPMILLMSWECNERKVREIIQSLRAGDRKKLGYQQSTFCW